MKNFNLPTLVAFSRALKREMHILTREPELTWQQLYNRLQWEGEEVKRVVAPELTRRSAMGSKPWMRYKTPYQESDALVLTLEGHTDVVTACAYSPDGSFIVSASLDSTLRIWKTSTGQSVCVLTGHTRAINDCVFSPNGCLIVSAGSDHTLRVWNVSSGESLLTLEGHTDRVIECKFSLDGNYITSISEDETIRVWEAATGKQVRTTINQNADTSSFFPKEDQSGHPKWAKKMSFAKSTSAFSPDGRFVATASADRWLRIWDTATGKLLHQLEGHSDFITSCAFSPDGLYVLSASWDKTLVQWELNSGRFMCMFHGHSDIVNACAFSPDGRTIVSASDDMTLQLWDASAEGMTFQLWDDSPRKMLSIHQGHRFSVKACAFSPDGQFIISGSEDGRLRMWNTGTGNKVLKPVQELSRRSTLCSYSSDGRLFFTRNNDSINLWKNDTDSPQNVIEIKDFFGEVAFSPDGRFLLSANRKSQVIWSTITGQQALNMDEFQSLSNSKWDDPEVISCAFSPNGQLIFLARSDGSLWMWETKNSYQPIWKDVSTKKQISSDACSFSPNGYFILTSSDDILQLRNAFTGELVRNLIGHSNIVTAARFSPDERLILSTSKDKTLRIWDFTTGETLFVLQGHSTDVTSCSFSPDGCRIISVSEDNTNVWEADTGHLLYRIEDHVKAAIFSPEASFFITLSSSTLQVREAASGAVVAHLAPLGFLSKMDLHPLVPQLIIGYMNCEYYLIDIFGVEFGPIIATAWCFTAGSSFRKQESLAFVCPNCRIWSKITRAKLGNEISCPRCGKVLKLNSFTIDGDWTLIAKARKL